MERGETRRRYVLNCSSCGAGMRMDDRKVRWECGYCGRVEVPNPDPDGLFVLGADTGLTCPVCPSGLVYATIADQSVVTCPECHGILMEVEIFLGVVAALRSRRAGEPEPHRPIDERELERHIRCPRCRGEMDTHPYGGPGSIVIDNCPRCEVNWLDAGELPRVVNGADTDYNLPEQDPITTVLYHRY